MVFLVLKGGEINMAYTPELTMKSSKTLRRISWGLGLAMTKSLELIFDYLPQILDREKVCQGCRDQSQCDECAFKNQNGIEKEVIAQE